MHFHDPSRTHLRPGYPCWLSSSAGLPPLQLTPHPTNPSLVVLTIFHATRGLWLSTDLPLTEIVTTLHFWAEDPEGTFLTLFGLADWPHDSYKPTTFNIIPTTPATSTPIEDLI